jgi:hypothetical protein
LGGRGGRRGAPVPRFKRRGLKRRTARALHGRSMGRGPATVFSFLLIFLFCFCFAFQNLNKKFSFQKNSKLQQI